MFLNWFCGYDENLLIFLDVWLRNHKFWASRIAVSLLEKEFGWKSSCQSNLRVRVRVLTLTPIWLWSLPINAALYEGSPIWVIRWNLSRIFRFKAEGVVLWPNPKAWRRSWTMMIFILKNSCCCFWINSWIKNHYLNTAHELFPQPYILQKIFFEISGCVNC